MQVSLSLMSGFIIVAFASLLMQDVAPHPSTRTPYQAPAIRPFEPASDFGRERAQGDAAVDAHRRSLQTPVTVEGYVRSYEFSPGDVEAAYDQGVASAEIRADQVAGPLDGRWRVMDQQGRPLFDLALSDAAGLVEGGWRGEGGSGAATMQDGRLTLDGLGALALEGQGDGWRGTLTANGRTQAVTLSRP